MMSLSSFPILLSNLVSHLWQTSLFVGIVAALTFAMKSNRARIRYAMWLAASIKFAVPFSLLIAVGRMIEWRAGQPTPEEGFTAVIGEIMTGPAVASEPGVSLSLISWLVGSIWLIGFILVLLVWFRSWYRTRRIVRLAVSPREGFLPLKSAVEFAEVRMSALTNTPGVFGFLRPILLLPVTIETLLAEDELASVVAHEAAHVRRRDNLWAAFHTFVTAVFWFHPFVWWIGKRLVEERERACDEAVLTQGFAPEVFGEGLLKVCRSAVGRPVACMVGIHSSDLKGRMEGIMSYSQLRNLGPVLRFTVGILMISSALGPVVLGFATQDAERTLALRRWLEEEVVYIISDRERTAFESLATLEEREYFIEQFWLRRDPDSRSEENEVREEHYSRILLANDRFAYGDVPGWQTDRAEMLIVYGPPDQIETQRAGPGQAPTERWRYAFIEEIGENVEFTFVDSGQTGEYRREN